MPHHLRIARPVSDLARSTDRHRRSGLPPRADASPAAPRHAGATAEDLLVFYIASEADWEAACMHMHDAGFKLVTPFNPYWGLRGRTFEDPDGYRVVLQRESWPPK